MWLGAKNVVVVVQIGIEQNNKVESNKLSL